MVHYLKKNTLPIKTDRLILRLLEPSEAGLMVRYVVDNREHLEPWEPLHTDGYYTLEFWEKELRNRQNEFFVGERICLAIFFREADEREIIGVCNFTEIMRGVLQACFLGYSVHRLYEGLGIMYEALGAAVDFVFNTFKLHRIMANYMPRNLRSGKVLQKLGFSIEGYAPLYLEIDGKWEDHVLTSKINSKWPPGNTREEKTTSAG